MEEKVLYQFGHMHKRNAYKKSAIADGVLKSLDLLDACHKLGLKKVSEVRTSRALTGQGKQAAVRDIAKELSASLDELGKVVRGYQDQARLLEDEIKPKRHPRDDNTYQIESREIRDHIRSLDPAEQEGFVLSALERNEDHILQAVLYAPIPFQFASEEMIERIQLQRSATQFPDEVAKLADIRLAEQETSSAISSVKAELARLGVDLDRVVLSSDEAA